MPDVVHSTLGGSRGAARPSTTTTTTTTTTKVLIIVMLHKVAGALYISDLKNDGNSQKSVVRQLKQMGLCLPSKRQQRQGGPDLCWQTVPRLRRYHRKGAVAKSYPTSWRHQQCSRVGRAKMATGDKL